MRISCGPHCTLQSRGRRGDRCNASLRGVEAATERFARFKHIEAHQRLWGPVQEDVAFAIDALAPASSVLIRPAGALQLLIRPAGALQLETAAARGMELFPADVFPSAEDK